MQVKSAKKVGLRKLFTRTRLFTGGVLLFAVLALGFIPYQQQVPVLGFLIPTSEATFIIDITRNDNTTSYRDVLVADGYLVLSGKGGLSAGNPLTLAVTLYFNVSVLGMDPTRVVFGPHGAYAYPLKTDPRGFPIFAAINLTDTGLNHKWFGKGDVIYYQGDNWGAFLFVFDDARRIALEPMRMPNILHIGTEDVTFASRTNSLVVSLSWAFLAFASAELRIDKNTEKTDSNQHHEN